MNNWFQVPSVKHFAEVFSGRALQGDTHLKRAAAVFWDELITGPCKLVYEMHL